MSSLTLHLRKTFTFSSEIFFPGLMNLFRAISLRVQMGLKTGEVGPATLRREIRLVADVGSDLKRILPAAVFMTLPFYWTSPIVFRYAPGLIPKAFYNYDLLLLKGKVRSQVCQQLAPLLLKKINSNLEKKLSPDQFMKWQKIMANESKLIFSFELFRNELNLFKLSHSQATLFAKRAGLALPYFIPKIRLLKWIDWILKDDLMIDKEGVRSLTEYELMEALADRGLSVSESLTNSRNILQNHIQFSKELQSMCLQGKSRLNALEKGAILSAMIISNAQSL